jgi:hypothetical protein
MATPEPPPDGEDEPWADGDFFPEKRPAGYPSFHNYRRDREAAKLSAQGYSALEIAEKLHLTDRATGDPDPRRAVKAVRRGLSQVHQFAADEMRAEQLNSLQMMKRHLWEQMDHEHVLVQQGKVIFHDGMPVEDRRFHLEVIDRLAKIEAQQAELMGTKAATRFSVEADQIGNEIATMIAALGAMDTTTTVEQIQMPELESGEDTYG